MPDCFSIETLRSWLAGELSTSERARIAAHVAGCTVCQSCLDARTDKPTRGRLFETSGIGEVDVEITERDVSELFLFPTEPSIGCKPVSIQTVGFAEPEAEIGTIGPFRLLDELGRGRMGIVYRAWDEPLGRVVAVKVLRPERAGAVDRLRLVREAQLASRFQNDHAVTIHSVVDPPDGLPYLVMEYVQGPSLAELIGSNRCPAPRELGVLVSQVAIALGAAHTAGLVHRDVKPSNILIDAKTGRAKLTDFGVVRTLAAPSTITREGFVAGTPAYMSPEQARGDPALDLRTDVYSLGATLYEGLTGQPPFAGALHAILRRITEEDPIPPRRFDHEIPGDLETICLKAMAKEPKARYQTALDLGDDLNRWLRNEPIGARPATCRERAWRACRRRPLVSGLAAALLMVATAGIAGIAWKWGEAVSERRRAELERDRAQRNFRQAREAVETYLTQVSDNDVLKSQNLEPLRRELLETARDFYVRFVEQDPDDPDLQAELGRTYARLGQPDLAQTTLEKALTYSEELARSHPANGDHRHLVANIAHVMASLNYHERHQPALARVLLKKALEVEQELAISFPAVAEYVYSMNNILRDFRDWFGDTARLNAVGDHFTALIQEHESRFAAERRDHIRLKRYYHHRAEIHHLLARHSEALADFKQAGSSEFESTIAALIQAERGEYDRAESAAFAVAHMGPGAGHSLYLAAQAGAFMAAVVRNDRSLPAARREELGEKYGKQAVQWLQKAHALKYFSTPSTRYLLADDRELAPLRSRDDYRALVARSTGSPRMGKER